jgi:N-acetyl-gamma-glutamyl-phosphate reductase / acetylglutamate kinase
VLDNVEDIVPGPSFVYRVGLCPVIIHGPQRSEIPERDGVIPDYMDGIRITGWSRSFSLVWLED